MWRCRKTLWNARDIMSNTDRSPNKADTQAVDHLTTRHTLITNINSLCHPHHRGDRGQAATTIILHTMVLLLSRTETSQDQAGAPVRLGTQITRQCTTTNLELGHLPEAA